MRKAIILISVFLIAASGCLDNVVETSTSTTTIICSWAVPGQSRSQCITKLAAAGNDSSLCGLIEDSLWADTCLRNVAESLLDEKLCDRIVSEDAKSECIKSIAWEMEDGATCSSMNDSNQRDSCYYPSAVRHANPDVCDRIESDSSKYRCRAITTRDSGECGNITQERARDLCYVMLASIKPEKSSCAKISAEDRKDECYTILAEKLFDVKMCSKVTDITQQKVCTEKAQNASNKLKDMQKNFGLNDSIKIGPQ
ncbi:MAG: hypothetical protein ABH834_00465 [Candidatus Altiarchaeota archaeon]